ncbi:MAG: hypothetical protein CMH96_03090 [Oceanospirillaceae bacterium]|nr:hypothetical protein [Oceanospirillaceae bacterium]HCI02131.1 hypothetical protein [Oceanospirillaceae bacterium]
MTLVFFRYFWELVYNPQRSWRLVRKQRYGLRHSYFTQLSWMAAIPSVSFYIGSTQMGWRIGAGDYHTLAHETAMYLGIALYISIIAFVSLLAFSVYWIERLYGSHAGFRNCMVLATFVVSPMLGAGICALLPLVWFNALVLLLAMFVSLYFLFTGMPVMMKVSVERSFLFCLATITVAVMVKSLYFGIAAFVFINWLPLTTL